MSEKWTNRQRRTNRLVRTLAGYVLSKNVTPAQLYGLCQLTWITAKYEGQSASYVVSTKIPALGNVMGKDYLHLSLPEIADAIGEQISNPAFRELVVQDTGFTNLYNAYRDSSLSWIQANFNNILPLFRQAFALENDNQGSQIIRGIETLPGIPRGESGSLLKPESLLTPVFFSLDGRVRFPIINGNSRVRDF